MAIFPRVARLWPLHCFIFQLLLVVGYQMLALLFYGHFSGSLFLFDRYPPESGSGNAANVYLGAAAFHVVLRLFTVSEYASTWHEQAIDLRYRAGTRVKDMDWSWMKDLDRWAVRYGVTALHLPWCVGWILTIHLYLLLSSVKEAGFPALLLLGAIIFVPRFLSTFMGERFYPHHIDRIHRNRDVL